MRRIKQLISAVLVAILRTLGTTIVDAETGMRLGRAFLFPWRGTIKVIGLEVPVRPVFLPQTRLTYWKQDIGFTTHPAPDFPRCAKDA
jgi:hypothetical protein